MTSKSGLARKALAGTNVLFLASLVSCTGNVTDPTPERGGTLQQGVHDEGLFEIDGDALDGAAPGDDWDTVLLGGGGSALVTTGVLSDPAGVSIFTQGGSKDIHDVPEWRHKDGSVPPKDDITNAYAAAYDLGGELFLYFGADRYAVNGDAQIGFWFFQNEVGLNADGTFSGEHADGDVLVLSDFTNGGKIGTVKVYQWLSAGGGSDGNLDFVAGGQVLGNPDATLFCLPGDEVCAAINQAATPAPWDYVPKFGPAGTFPPGAFFEGGVNLSALFSAETCFASFLAETRASQSVNSVLKDFVLGAFDTCKEEPPPPPPKSCCISVHKECEVIKKNDEWCDKLFTASFTATVTNHGPETLPVGTVITVVDDASTAGDPSDDETVSLTLDAPLAAGASMELSGTFQTNDNPPLYNVAHATADTGATTCHAESEPTACLCQQQ